jgi:hypothetical protein
MSIYRDNLIDIYFDYVNNYLTVDRFAEFNGLTVEQAVELIAQAREVAESEHPEA